jgi:hypothetical protein
MLAQPRLQTSLSPSVRVPVSGCARPVSSLIETAWWLSVCTGLAIACASCGPNDAQPVEPPAKVTVRGEVTSLAGSQIDGAFVVVDGLPVVRTDALGSFEVPNVVAKTRLEIDRDGYVRRKSTIDLKTRKVFSLIDTSLDERALAELLAAREMWQWRYPPKLRIQTRLLDYSVADDERRLTVAGEDIAPGRLFLLEELLGRAIRVLTNGRFNGFVGRVYSQPTSDVFNAFEECSLTVAFVRQRRGPRLHPRPGYSRTGDIGPFITSAYILLDESLDLTDRFGRGVVAHELGHSLGYAHVMSVPSVMSPDNASFVARGATSFDRRAFALLNDRGPGWRLPDDDPADQPQSFVCSGT